MISLTLQRSAEFVNQLSRKDNFETVTEIALLCPAREVDCTTVGRACAKIKDGPVLVMRGL